MENEEDFSSDSQELNDLEVPQNSSSLTYPSFKLTRGDNTLIETIQFTPKSLMTIFVQGTGITKMTSIIMKDHLGQIRYKSANSGPMHEYITRLQNTRSYGLWKIIIHGLLPDEKTVFEIVIPFFLVKNIDPLLDEPLYKPVVVEVDKGGVTDEEVFEIKGIGMTDIEVSGAYNDFEPFDNTNLLDEVLKDEIKASDKTPKLKIIKQRQNIEENESEMVKVVDESSFEEVEIDRSEKTDNEDEIEDYHEFTETDQLEDTRWEDYYQHSQIVTGPTFEVQLFNKTEDRDTLDIINEEDAKNSKIVLSSQDNLNEMDKEETDLIEDQSLDFNDELHLEEIMKEIDTQSLESIKELFIPLDEIKLIDHATLNRLNKAEIYYIEEFLLENLTDLLSYTDLSLEEILEIKKQIIAIVKNKENPIFSKYREYGEIKDNTLLYSTVKVSEINGIGEDTYQKLEKSGIGNITDLANTHVKILSKISGFSCKKAVEFIVEAKSLVYTRVTLIDYDFDEDYPLVEYTKIGENSQLDAISSIKPVELNKLYGLGINNLGKLVKENPVKLQEAINVKLSTIISWNFEAQVMMKNRVSLQFRNYNM